MGGRAGKWSLICPLFVSTPLLTKSAAGRRGRSCCEASQQCTLCGIYGHMRAETPLPQALRDRSRTATRRLRSRSSCRTHSASRRRRPPEPHAGSTLLSSRCRSASGLAVGSSTGRTELSQQRLPNSSSQKERLWLRAGNPFGAMTRHATWSSEPSGRKSDARARLPRSQSRFSCGENRRCVAAAAVHPPERFQISSGFRSQAVSDLERFQVTRRFQAVWRFQAPGGFRPQAVSGMGHQLPKKATGDRLPKKVETFF